MFAKASDIDVGKLMRSQWRMIEFMFDSCCHDMVNDARLEGAIAQIKYSEVDCETTVSVHRNRKALTAFLQVASE